MCVVAFIGVVQNVIDIPSQLEYFREYKKKLEAKMGKQKMEKHIEEALFCVSAGTNDFVINYFIIPIRRKTFTIEAYQQFVISNLKQFIQVNSYFMIFDIPKTFFFF